MNEVNLQALANQGTALQSHRGGTGEVRYETVETLDARRARRRRSFTQDDAMVVRASYRAAKPVDRPVFQVAIVDVDTGVVVTTASSAGRDGASESKAAARSTFDSISCRCGRASTCCGCRSPTAISWRRTTRSPRGRGLPSPARAAAWTAWPTSRTASSRCRSRSSTGRRGDRLDGAADRSSSRCRTAPAPATCCAPAGC